MSTIQDKWLEVDEWRKKLDAEAFITSQAFPGSKRVGHVPGVVFMVNREIAARHLATGTHRLSTDEEIAAYKAEFDKRAEASRATAAAARGTTQVTLSPESLAAILGRKKEVTAK